MKRASCLLALCLFALVPACAQREPAKQECICAPAEAIVDPVLLAFLSKARAAHHEADLAEDSNDPKRAIEPLAALVKSPRPGGASPPPEVEEVIADTHARLADLRSQQGDYDTALGDIDAGLTLAKAPTHFRGHLFEVKGVVLERRSKALKEKGEAGPAEHVKKLAIEAFDKAIEIQNQVIESSLAADKDGGPPKP